ncbi:MAG TPA: amidohydrolase family protein [Solirubrobacteraceae bacterium]|nr:amidohydrolase family protein [Solirubrobacteraceae bacterium]
MIGAVDLSAEDRTEGEPLVRLVDSDVHAQPMPATLMPYLSVDARRYLERYGRRTHNDMHAYPRARGAGTRLDAWPAQPGAPPGGDPELLRSQLLDEWGVDYAVLQVLNALDCYDPADIAVELPRAINDWLTQAWLEFDDRLRAAIVVPHEYAHLAVREIERRAPDPRFVAVLMPANAQELLGSERYWPIYEAASAHRLPIMFHTGGFIRNLGAGPPSYYIASHVNTSPAMQTQLVSMVASGLFQALTNVRIVVTECGVSWVTALRWAMDSAWELMGPDHPRLERRPSEYIHDHVWFTTQPVEEPAEPQHLLYAIEQAQLADRLLFATDYPHWDFDSPTQALPRAMDAKLRAAIMHGNALELFGLRPVRSQPSPLATP